MNENNHTLEAHGFIVHPYLHGLTLRESIISSVTGRDGKINSIFIKLILILRYD